MLPTRVSCSAFFAYIISAAIDDVGGQGKKDAWCSALPEKEGNVLYSNNPNVVT